MPHRSGKRHHTPRSPRPRHDDESGQGHCLSPSGYPFALKHPSAQGSAHSNHVPSQQAHGGSADRARRASGAETPTPLLEWIASCIEDADTATEGPLERREPAPAPHPGAAGSRAARADAPNGPQSYSEPAPAPEIDWMLNCVEDADNAIEHPIGVGRQLSLRRHRAQVLSAASLLTAASPPSSPKPALDRHSSGAPIALKALIAQSGIHSAGGSKKPPSMRKEADRDSTHPHLTVKTRSQRSASLRTNNCGGDLLSHTHQSAVPSAL